jgi:hypothetical protein
VRIDSMLFAHPPGGLQMSPTDQNSARRDMATWTIAAFTIILAFATIITSYFIYGQWTAAVEAQNETRQQLKAYVTFEGGSQITGNDPSGKTINYLFQPRFHNWGATRTSHFVAWASVKYFDGDVPNNLDFSKPFEKVSAQDTILGPNGVSSIGVTLPVDDAIKTKNKQGIAVIWGHADWGDIYNPGDLRSVSFCLKLVPVSSDGDNRILFAPQPYKPECNTGMS